MKDRGRSFSPLTTPSGLHTAGYESVVGFSTPGVRLGSLIYQPRRVTAPLCRPPGSLISGSEFRTRIPTCQK